MFDIPQWSDSFVLILIPSIIFCFGIFGWLLKDRNSVMRADIADASGFKYTKESADVLQGYSHFETFTGTGIECGYDVLVSDSNGCWRCVADYMIPASRDNRRQTVCMIRSELLELPHFSIQPASWFSRQIIKLVGKSAAVPFVEYPDDADFNTAYYLQAADAVAVQAVLTNEVRAYLKSQRGRRFCCEAEGQTLVFYTRSLVRPQKVLEMFDESLEILRVFTLGR